MKRIFQTVAVATMLTCAVFSAWAQEITLEDVSNRGFDGVHVQVGQGAYTFYFGEKSESKGMAFFWLEIFDLELNSINKVKIEISKNSKLASSTFTGSNFLFAFNDASKKTSTYITFDKTGNVIEKRVTEKVKMALLSEENAPQFFPAGDDEFLVIQPIKEKKTGYSIQRFNTKFEQKYSFEYTPEKGAWKAVTSELKGDKLYVIQERRQSLTSKSYTNFILCYDIATGKEIYACDLYDGEDSGFPNFFNVDDEGVVTSGGMFFKGEKFDNKNSDGIFFLTLDHGGKRMAYSKTSWKTVKDNIKGEFSSAVFGGKTKMVLHNIVKKADGTYTIIGESFRKSNDANMAGLGGLKMAGGMSGGAGTSGNPSESVGFTIMDFIMFNYDASGKMISIDKIEKPNRVLTITGKVAKQQGLEIALFMKRAKMFCYRSVIEDGGKQYVFFVNREGVKDYASFLPIGATSTDGIPQVDLNKGISEGLNNMAKLGAIMGDNEQYNTGSFGQLEENPNRYRGGVYFKPGYVLAYKYFNFKLNIWLEPISKM